MLHAFGHSVTDKARRLLPCGETRSGPFLLLTVDFTLRLGYF